MSVNATSGQKTDSISLFKNDIQGVKMISGSPLATVTFKILLSAGRMMRPFDLQHIIKGRIFSKRNLPMATSSVWFRLH